MEVMSMNTGCEIPEHNPPLESIKSMLREKRTVAVVGLSPKPERDSHRVAQYLQEKCYDVVPINPGQKRILGRPCYPNLKAVPFPVQIVNIFRRPDAVGPIVDDAVTVGAHVVWMQLGIVNNEAARKARDAGLEVVMNKCIKIEHKNMKKEQLSI